MLIYEFPYRLRNHITNSFIFPPTFANLRGRWLWWNEGEELIEIFSPRDKVWLFDLRLSKGFMVTNTIRLAVIVDAFNITDQLYWDRKELPNPRRWIQAGFELKFN